MEISHYMFAELALPFNLAFSSSATSEIDDMKERLRQIEISDAVI